MEQICDVRLRRPCKVARFYNSGPELQRCDWCVIKTEHGLELGLVLSATLVDGEALRREVEGLPKVMRKATERDLHQYEENKRQEAEALDICKQKILQRKLPMKLVTTEYTLDTNKIIFYFVAEGRVDFRELVKDLARHFRRRIELRQIGVRDEARILGGLGNCGRTMCCATFLREFAPVSIRMAKRQNLALNPSKISGVCGRLMCCIQYEDTQYQDEKETAKPALKQPALAGLESEADLSEILSLEAADEFGEKVVVATDEVEAPVREERPRREEPRKPHPAPQQRQQAPQRRERERERERREPVASTPVPAHAGEPGGETEEQKQRSKRRRRHHRSHHGKKHHEHEQQPPQDKPKPPQQ